MKNGFAIFVAVLLTLGGSWIGLVVAPTMQLGAAKQTVALVTGIGDTEILPPWQIVRERRATFAALPQEERKRPGPQTGWSNLALAGDWTATGLPATIEGAIRSGNRAAKLMS